MIEQAIKIKQLQLKNRVVMAPMCMYEADEDGMVKDFHVVHYATRAIGGVGLIIQEATAVEPFGRITSHDLGIWDDKHLEGLKKIVRHVHQFGAQIGIQLAHAGRKARQPKAYAPSHIAYDGYDKPIQMTQDDINRVIQCFQDATRRAHLAGYDFIEIHAAHGYLIHEFLSPLSNHRQDRYQDGVLFLKEIIEAIQKEWPSDKALGIRISAEEYVNDGLHPKDLAHIINRVKGLGIDVINVSSGGNINVNINAYPGYQLAFAETIKKETGLIVMGGGLIEDLKSADQAIQNKQCDMVYLGRLLLRDPYVVINQLEVDYPKAYQRGKK